MMTQTSWADHVPIMIAKVGGDVATEEAAGAKPIPPYVAVFDVPPRKITRRAEVRITHAHILSGIHGNVWADPVVYAVKAAIPWSVNVRSSTVDIAFTIRGLVDGQFVNERFVAITPPEVAAWIERFDARKPCKPLVFTLEWEEDEPADS